MIRLRLLLYLTFAGSSILAPFSAAAVDTNTNGVSDVWEYRYFGRLLDPSEVNADYSGDGHSNLQKSLFGLDPFLQNAFPRISAPTISAGAATFSFPSVRGIRYQPQTSPDLLTWIDAGSIVTGNGGVVSTSVPAPAAKLFIRVRDAAPLDTDNDGLTDYEEFLLGSDPTKSDTDSDGLTDLEEYRLKYLYGVNVDPTKAFTVPGVKDGSSDSDGDGVSDIEELRGGSNPLDPTSYPPGNPNIDSDGNGLRDTWEMQYFGHLGVDPDADPDGDGLTNRQEQQLGTNPTIAKTNGVHFDGQADSDNDGVIDVWELEDGTDPFNAGSVDLATNFIVLRGQIEHLSQWGPVTDQVQFDGTILRATAIGFETAQSSTTLGGIRNEVTSTQILPSGNDYRGQRFMRFRKGVKYKVEFTSTSNNLPFVSGKYFWTTTGNSDELDNKVFAFQVTGRQWYSGNTVGTPTAANPSLSPNPDVFTTCYTLKSPSQGGPDAALFPNGFLFLNPLAVSPTKTPFTGIDFAGLTFLKGVTVPTDLTNVSVKVNGVESSNLVLDPLTQRTIYFRPPALGTAQTGVYDLEVSGLAFAGDLPTDANGALVLRQAFRYTTNIVDGTRAFGQSNDVRMQFVRNSVTAQRNNGGISDQDAIAEYSESADAQFVSQPDYYQSFFTTLGAAPDASEVVRLQYDGQRLGRQFLFRYRSYIASQFPPPLITPEGVQAKATVPDAYRQGADGSFRIVRPASSMDALTVSYTISGTAGPGVDYVTLSGSATIPPGEQGVEVPVDAISGGAGDKTVVLTVIAGTGYSVGLTDQATVTIHDGTGARLGGVEEFMSPAVPDGVNDFPRPIFPSRTFFSDVRAVLDRSSRKGYFGAVTFPGFPYPTPTSASYVVFDAAKILIKPYVAAAPGTTISDAVTANGGALTIINGALCNYRCQNSIFNFNLFRRKDPDREEFRTIGQILINGILDTSTSSDPSRKSWSKANARYYFGFNSLTPNIVGGYVSGGPGAQLPGSFVNGISGVLGLIVSDPLPRKLSFTNDLDLQAYLGNREPNAGYNVVALDRETGLVMIVTKAPYVANPGLMRLQELLYSSGVDEAIVTDGGGSTGCYVDGFGVIVRGRRHVPGVPDNMTTVTNYFIISPR